MSDRTKLTAAQAAKKAEEAIRNAEMLEKIARDAVEEATRAREEAEQAKALAKKSSKVEKVVEMAASTEMVVVDKKFILDYLQKNAWDLHKKLNNVYDIRFEDDPPRVVVVAVPGPNGPDAVEKPKLIHNGVEIPVEMEMKKPSPVVMREDEEGNAVVTQDEQTDPGADEVYHRHVTGKAAEVLGIGEALGPHSTENAAKQREAYQAWLKRHPGVKIQKG